jgi:hypothetical protein
LKTNTSNINASIFAAGSIYKLKNSLLGYNAEFAICCVLLYCLAYSFDSEDMGNIFFWNFG